MGITSITPGRHSKLILDPYGLPDVLRPSQTIRKPAATIVAARTPLASSHHVQHLPHVGWTLAHSPSEKSGFITVPGAGQVIPPSDVTTPVNLGTVNSNHAPAVTALPGMLTGMPAPTPLSGGSVLSFVKQVPQTGGGDWGNSNNNLPASQGALPKPILPSEDLPMDRVLHGRVTFGSNAAFSLMFQVPAGYHGPDNLLTFYFGGSTDATNAAGNAIEAGRYCLNLRGSTTAILYEWDGAGWQRRFVFPWATRASHGMAWHLIKVRPVGSSDIQFETHEGDISGAGAVGGGGFTLFPLLTTEAATALQAKQLFEKSIYTYRHSPQVTGTHKPTAVAGPGPVLVDQRRDLRIPFQIARNLYAPFGVLIDLPFSIDFPVLPLTAMTLIADSLLPPGTSLSGQIIDPKTGTAVLPGGTDPATGGQKFYTNAAQTVYAARFDFASDSSLTQTPVLRSYEVKVDNVTVVRVKNQIVGGDEASGSLIRSVSVTGPDVDATHETASLQINDLSAKFSNHLSTGILENRGRVPAHLDVFDNSGALLTRLFSGETARCTATRKGKKTSTAHVPTLLFPESEWRQLDISLVGTWARLAEFVNFSMLSYLVDPAYFKLTGKQIGWKISDILRDILGNQLGFGVFFQDIPDLPLRLWVPPDQAANGTGWGADEAAWLVQPGTSLADLLHKLSRDYLGMVLLFDCNAGTNGMWRLIQTPLIGSAYGNPPLPTPVAKFLGYPDKAASGPRLTTSPASYNIGSTFIQRGSLHTFVQAPECNFVLVLGAGGQVPSVALKDPKFKNWATIVNPLSNDFPGFGPSDPTSPDYLGRFVPVVHVDPLLMTPEACAWVAKRIYDVAAHARSWVKFRAPLLLITDPSDSLQTRPRPCRIGDPVLVTTGNANRMCVVRSVNPDYTHDSMQMAEYEALIVN